MRIVVDRSRCQGVGMCESIRPDVFEVGDDGELVVHDNVVDVVDAVEVDADTRADLVQAVESCPTQALALAE